MAPPPPPARGIALRAVLCATLLFVEATLLTGSLDVAALATVDAGWARLLELSRFGLTSAIAAGTGLILFGRRALARALDEAGAEAEPRTVALLGAHACGLAGFALVSQALFETPPADAWVGALGLLAWALLGLAALAPLALLLWNRRAWTIVLRDGAGVLVLGLVVGLVASQVARDAEAVLWNPLSRPTLAATRALLGLLVGGEVLPPIGTILGTRRFAVDVDVGCTGLEGIGLVTVFLGAYLVWARERLAWPRAALLVPFGVVLVWSANVARLVALVLIGHHGAPELAVGAFHTRAGWMLFCAVALGCVALAERAFVRTESEPAEGGRSRALAYTAPLLLLLGVRLVGGALTDHTERVHLVAALLAALALALQHRRLRAWRVTFSPLAIAAGLLVFVVWVALDASGASRSGPEAAALAATPGLSTLAHVLTTVLIVPVAEELAFRGYLLRRLISERFEEVSPRAWTPFALLASSLLFGLAHERWLVGTLAGLAYALVVVRTGRLTNAIVAHAGTNALLLLWALTG